LNEAICVTLYQAFFTKKAVEQIAIISIKNFSDFENGLASENEAKIKKIQYLNTA
jgi:D-lactate dehydrogenase